jgi:hypothetical protein
MSAEDGVGALASLHTCVDANLHHPRPVAAAGTASTWSALCAGVDACGGTRREGDAWVLTRTLVRCASHFHRASARCNTLTMLHALSVTDMELRRGCSIRRERRCVHNKRTAAAALHHTTQHDAATRLAARMVRKSLHAACMWPSARHRRY